MRPFVRGLGLLAAAAGLAATAVVAGAVPAGAAGKTTIVINGGITFPTDNPPPAGAITAGPNYLPSRTLPFVILPDAAGNGFFGEVVATEYVRRIARNGDSFFTQYAVQTFTGSVLSGGVPVCTGTMTQNLIAKGPLTPGLSIDKTFASALTGTWTITGSNMDCGLVTGRGTVTFDPGAFLAPLYSGTVRY